MLTELQHNKVILLLLVKD